MQRGMDKSVSSEGTATVQDTPFKGVPAMNNKGAIPLVVLVVMTNTKKETK